MIALGIVIVIFGMLILIWVKTHPDEATSGIFNSDEECEDAGGIVIGDPGDGSAACENEEDFLGVVKVGIEGGVCCSTP